MRTPRNILVLIALLFLATVLPAAAGAGMKPPPPPPGPDLQARINALAARVSSLEGKVSTLQTTVSIQAAQITALQTSSVMALGPYLTVTTDARGPLARFSGVNIQLVNGTGKTGDVWNPPNGLGNLIIGYDTVRSFGPDTCSRGWLTDPSACLSEGGVWARSHKTGSHYLIIGDENNYSQVAGMVVGIMNTSSAPYASVSGGQGNTAIGAYSTISGGGGNTTSSGWTSVTGGQNNTASGSFASVSGGYGNNASTNLASILGGANNTAGGTYATVSGGTYNSATGESASISGGWYFVAPLTAQWCGGNGNPCYAP